MHSFYFHVILGTYQLICTSIHLYVYILFSGYYKKKLTWLGSLAPAKHAADRDHFIHALVLVCLQGYKVPTYGVSSVPILALVSMALGRHTFDVGI